MRGCKNASINAIRQVRTITQQIGTAISTNGDIIIIISTVNGAASNLIGLTARVASRPDHHRVSVLLSAKRRISVTLLSVTLRDLNRSTVSLAKTRINVIARTRRAHTHVLAVGPRQVRHRLTRNGIVIITNFRNVDRAASLRVAALNQNKSSASTITLTTTLRTSGYRVCASIPNVLAASPHLIPRTRLVRRVADSRVLRLTDLKTGILRPHTIRVTHGCNIALIIQSD